MANPAHKLDDPFPKAAVPKRTATPRSRPPVAETSPPSIMEIVKREAGDDPERQTRLAVAMYISAEEQEWNRWIGSVAHETLGHCVEQWKGIHSELERGKSVETKLLKTTVNGMDDILMTAPGHRWQLLRKSVRALLLETEMVERKTIGPGSLAERCVQLGGSVGPHFEFERKMEGGPDRDAIRARELSEEERAKFKKASEKKPGHRGG